MTQEKKTEYTLEMTSPSRLKAKWADEADLRIERVEIPCPEYSHFLHLVVGSNHRWGGRENWGQTQWRAHVERDDMETWVMYAAGTPAGYYELVDDRKGGVRVLSFGLLPQFIAQGLHQSDVGC